MLAYSFADARASEKGAECISHPSARIAQRILVERARLFLAHSSAEGLITSVAISL